ncbi:MAG TPA: ABC transporter permease [Rhizomicrobium sp.]|nr:ABC transporter permease [Rhizomicrobium sp.]
MSDRFSFARVGAVLMKEFVQMRRDRITLAMILGVPVMQLFLFGFAINLDPKHLPTAISADDSGRLTRALVSSLENSDYFTVIKTTRSPKEARELLEKGDVNFVIEIPVNFSRDLVKGQQPSLLVDVDATDPASGTNAIGTFAQLAQVAFRDDLVGPLAARAPPTPAYQIVIHRRYNPEINTQYSVVPGLLGVILTMTMVVLTSMAVTRERERGTYENLLAMPTTPVEIMLGKILPNIVVGLIQSVIILLAARWVFNVPMLGSFTLLYGALTIFIAVNLAVGYTFSTIAQSQLQAMQMMVFFLLPSILLSGFAFPFRGMPDWAQWIGEFLPATHIMRVVRGILLKGNGPLEVWPDVWPLILALFTVGLVALLRFRRTLD